VWQGPPAMTAEVQDWATGMFATHVLGMLAAGRVDGPAAEVLAKAARKYAKKGRIYTRRVTKKFLIDLSGWKYLSKCDPDELPEFLTDEGDRVLVALEFNHMGAAGEWLDLDGERGLHGEMVVNVTNEMHDLWENPTARQFREAVAYLRDTVRHELEHFAQDFLKDYLEEVEGVEALPGQRGRPSTPGTRERAPGAEDLEAIEFYPRLRDEVHSFLRSLHGVPEDEWRDHLREWVKTRGFLRSLYKFGVCLRAEWPTATSKASRSR